VCPCSAVRCGPEASLQLRLGSHGSTGISTRFMVERRVMSGESKPPRSLALYRKNPISDT
jgi:hypothetical protein